MHSDPSSTRSHSPTLDEDGCGFLIIHIMRNYRGYTHYKYSYGKYEFFTEEVPGSYPVDIMHYRIIDQMLHAITWSNVSFGIHTQSI